MRKGSIEILKNKLIKLDNDIILLQKITSLKNKRTENLLERYHESWSDIENWVEKNPKYELYRGYEELELNSKYLLNSISKRIDINDIYKKPYW